MKPSIAEAKKVLAAEAQTAAVVALEIKLDRIEAKLDALLEQKASATKKATAEK